MKNKTITGLLLLVTTMAVGQNYPKKRIQYGWDANNSEWYFQLKNDHVYHNDFDSVEIETSQYDFNINDWDNREKATIVYTELNGDRYAIRNYIDRWDLSAKKYTVYSKMSNSIGVMSVSGQLYKFETYSTVYGYELSLMAWDTVSHSVSKPNINGLVGSKTTLVKYNSELLNHDKTTFFYTQNRQVGQEWKYDWVNNAWVETEGIENKYDFTTRLLTETIHFDFDKVKKTFSIPKYRFLYTYDDHNNVIKTEVELYDLNTSSYVPNARITNTWNLKNQLTEELTEIYEPTGKTYSNMQKITYEYDSGTNGVEDNTTNWTIYPNPSNGMVTVDIPNAESFQLIGLDGSIVKSFDNNLNHSIVELDFTSVNAGMYILQAQLSNGTVQLKKVVKN